MSENSWSAFSICRVLGWDAAKQLAVELEIDSDGSTFKSTHQISESGQWLIPTEGTSMVDGKPLHVESFRVLTLKSNDEWEVTGTHRVIGGKPAPHDVSKMRRK